MDQVEINFKVKYVTLLIGIVAIVCLIISGVLMSWKVENILSASAIGVAITALIYTALNSHLNLKIHVEQLRTKKLENAIVFIEYSSSPEMTKAISRGVALRKEVQGKDAKEIKAIFENNPEKKEAIVMIFNYFERLGIVVRFGAADEDALKEYYRGAIRRYWHSFGPWVRDSRTEFQDDNLFREMEFLVSRWN